MLAKSMILFFCSLGCFLSLESAYHPKQGNPYFDRPAFESIEAFDKIYVNKSAILSMPGGTYLKLQNGGLEKVRVLSHDCQGAYILRIHTVCEQCGRVYSDKDSPEGWCCLSHEIEIMPSIWIQP